MGLRMNESRFVQVRPLEKLVEESSSDDLTAVRRETVRRARSRSTGLLRDGDGPPTRHSEVCGPREGLGTRHPGKGTTIDRGGEAHHHSSSRLCLTPYVRANYQWVNAHDHTCSDARSAVTTECT